MLTENAKERMMIKKTVHLGIMLLLLTIPVVLTGCDPQGNTSTTEEKTEHGAHGDKEHKEEHRELGDVDHDDHKGDDDHTGHDEHEDEDEQVVRLSDQELKEFDIEIAIARPGSLRTYVSLPGEVVLNTDRRAHIVPRVSGIVRKVNKKLGDQVAAGEIVAKIESRELAELKVNYLSAYERFILAKEIFSREEKLWKKQITAEQDYLTTRQALAEARIELRSAEQKLHALGFSEEDLTKQHKSPDATFTSYLVKAPFAGTVIEKHITLGETVKNDTEIFVIADLSSVWVDITVYQKDLPLIKKGLPVIIDAGHGLPPGQGTISYVGPIVGETTRTSPARIVLNNESGQWRPGTFITAQIVTGDLDVPLLIPRTALQDVDDRQVVFIRTEKGFEPSPVTIGRNNREAVEIVEGLKPGQEYVSKGAFTLKAQLSKGAFGDGHGH